MVKNQTDKLFFFFNFQISFPPTAVIKYKWQACMESAAL